MGFLNRMIDLDSTNKAHSCLEPYLHHLKCKHLCTFEDVRTKKYIPIFFIAILLNGNLSPNSQSAQNPKIVDLANGFHLGRKNRWSSRLSKTFCLVRNKSAQIPNLAKVAFISVSVTMGIKSPVHQMQLLTSHKTSYIISYHCFSQSVASAKPS
jgi:hypothetical protein